MDVPSIPLVKLDLGPGKNEYPGFIRVGLSPEFDVTCDLRAIPLPDDYADEAMAIHVIEHFYAWEVEEVLREWRRILKPGGLLVLECPDIYKCCVNFVKDWGDNPRNSLYGIFGDYRYKDPLMIHRHGWTPDTLGRELRKAGFAKIREKAPRFHAQRQGRDLRLEARK